MKTVSGLKRWAAVVAVAVLMTAWTTGCVVKAEGEYGGVGVGVSQADTDTNANTSS